MKQLLILLLLITGLLVGPSGSSYGQSFGPSDSCYDNAVSLITYNSARINTNTSSGDVSGTTVILNYVRQGFTDTVRSSTAWPNGLRNLTGLASNTTYVYYYAFSNGSEYIPQTPGYYFTTLRNTIVYTPMTAAGYQYKYGKFDSGLMVPRLDTTIGRAPDYGGSIVWKPEDSTFYGYNGTYWHPLAIDSSGIIALLDGKVDSVTISGDYMFYWKQGVSYGSLIPTTGVTPDSALGVLKSQTSFPTTAGYTNNGATVSVVSDKLQFSGGVNDYDQTLDIDGVTNLEYWTASITVKVGSKSGTSYGFGIGMRSTQATNPQDEVALFNMTSTGGMVSISNGGTGTSTIGFSVNDYIVLTFTRALDEYTVTAVNQTTGVGGPATHFLRGSPISTLPQPPNFGRFAIYSFGGTFTVDSISVTTTTPKRADLLVFGDSKAWGAGLPLYTDAFGQKLKANFPHVVMMAGSSATTVDMSNAMQYIIDLKPVAVAAAIGSNDVRAGTSLSVIEARYDSCVAAAAAAGIGWWHILPFAEGSGGITANVGPLAAYIQATYSADSVIDTYNPIKNNIAAYIQADSVHPNSAGNALIYNKIIAKLFHTPISEVNHNYNALGTGITGDVTKITTSPTTAVGIYNNGFRDVVEFGNLDFSAKRDGQIAAGTNLYITQNGALAITATSGAISLNTYGSGTHVGTPTKNLQVNASGDIIEGALASTPTWQQVLTAGSTLTGNNTINGGGYIFTNNNMGEYYINTAGATQFQNTLGTTLNTLSLTGFSQLGSSTISGRASDILIYPDTIIARPSLGNLYIDTLNYSSNTDDSMVVWRKSTGKVGMRAVPSGGSAALTSTQIGYGSGANVLTGEAAFTYDATDNQVLVTGVGTAKGFEADGVHPALTLNGSSTSRVQFTDGTFTANILMTAGVYDLAFNLPGQTNTLYLKQSNGFVGLKNASPGAQLDVTGTLWASGAVKFSNYGAGTATFDASGNITSVSDERLKNVQSYYKSGLKELMKIKPITYKWNKLSGNETDSTYAGFSAQNVQANIPLGTGVSKDGYLSLQDRAILATLVNAVKEQQVEIERLKAEIKRLKK